MGKKKLNICICDMNISNCIYVADVIRTCDMDMNNQNAETWIDYYDSGMGVLKAIDSVIYDIAFIDMKLKDMSGVELANIIRKEKMCSKMHIIYMSVNAFYSMELFDTNPLHFLLKPLEINEIKRAYFRVKTLMLDSAEVFSYVKDRTLKYEKLDNIMYFESMNRSVIMHTFNEEITFYGKLKDVFEQLKMKGFFYVHQSFLVNEKCIRNIVANHEIELNNREKLKISYSRRKEVIGRIQYNNR